MCANTPLTYGAPTNFNWIIRLPSAGAISGITSNQLWRVRLRTARLSTGCCSMLTPLCTYPIPLSVRVLHADHTLHVPDSCVNTICCSSPHPPFVHTHSPTRTQMRHAQVRHGSHTATHLARTHDHACMPVTLRYAHLVSADLLPHFAVSWILTWYTHDVDDLDTIRRVFDACIAQHPFFPA
jgi:hypothetical protein